MSMQRDIDVLRLEEYDWHFADDIIRYIFLKDDLGTGYILVTVIDFSATLTSWWRHQMETFPHYWPGPLCGEFTSRRWIPLTRPVTMFSLIWAWTKRWRRWFETPSRSIWRHCNVNEMKQLFKTIILTWNSEGSKLVQAMAMHQKDPKPLTKPEMTQFTDSSWQW